MSEIPVHEETLGGSLIDAARISVMGAMHILPDRPGPVIISPGEPDSAHESVHECLEQAMEWLNAARAVSIGQASAPPTSMHVIQESLLPGPGRDA